MKKFLFLALVAFAAVGLFVSCSSGGDDDGSAGDINGTWTLSTVDGKSASSQLYNLTMTVSDSATYTVKGTVWGFPGDGTGTVVAKSDTVYTFTNSDDETTDYTLDGDSLTGTSVDDDNTYVWIK